MDAVSERLGRVLERIQDASRKSGRSPQAVTLLAVTKSVSLERVLPFLRAGVCHVGENRVQEALGKYAGPDGKKQLDPAVQLHMIGHLQGNKAKKAAALFDMVQSLDSVALGDDLNRHAQAAGRVLDCLVEVKVSTEPTKTGLEPDRLDDLLSQAQNWPNLKIRGVMGIAPETPDPEQARPYFSTLRTLFERTRLEILSMGMSHDFEIAIEEGSTMVRLGTVLFGERTA